MILGSTTKLCYNSDRVEIVHKKNSKNWKNLIEKEPSRRRWHAGWGVPNLKMPMRLHICEIVAYDSSGMLPFRETPQGPKSNHLKEA